MNTADSAQPRNRTMVEGGVWARDLTTHRVKVGAALRHAQFLGMAQVHSLAGQTSPACETNKFTPFKLRHNCIILNVCHTLWP